MKKTNNNRGFTLTELIAVIVIIGILISVGTITFINVRNKVLKKDYNNLVTYLETKASEYANDTNITTISVEDLIKEGYVNPDDQDNVYNPETKESMNCYIIKSTFEDGKYVAKLAQDLGKEEGKCKTYTKTNRFSMCKYNNETKKCDNLDKDVWYNKDITLGVKYSNKDEIISDANATFNWTSTNGFSSQENLVETKTNVISQNTYKCEITIGENIDEVNAVINIDKQAPTILDIKYDKNWASEKNVVVEAYDMDGSGILGYSFVDENASCGSFKSENNKKYTVVGTNTYKVCVSDKAGNVSEKTFVIDKIDTATPVAPDIKASDNITSGKWHNKEFTLNFTSNNELSQSIITYYYSFDNKNFVYTGDTLNVSVKYHDETVYVKACNEAGTCSNVKNYKIMIDLEAPVIKVKSKTLKYALSSKEDVLNNITVTDAVSGVDYVNIVVNDKVIKNISTLTAGVYTLRYEAYDKAGNKSVSENVSLTIFVPQVDVDYTEDEITYVVPISGTYRINLWGAQGSGSGGKGAYLGVTAYFEAGDVLTMAVGGTNGYNGGGVGASGTSSGGGATTVKKNGTYIVRAAGGGGGTSGTAGGSDNGSGGASAGAGAGRSGTNSGGGSSSLDYNYSCNCDTCGGGCKEQSSYDCHCSTCGGGCKEYYDHYCAEWKDCSDKYPGCKTCVKDVANCKTYYPTYDCNCRTCHYCSEYYPTYSCNCSTCTTKGNSGRGGSNYIANGVTVVEKTNGNRSGNGKLELKFVS